MNSCCEGAPENNLKLPEHCAPSRDTVRTDLARYERLLPDDICEFGPALDSPTLNLQVMGHHILSVDGVIMSFDTGRERFAFNRFCDYADIPGSQRELSSLIDFWDAMPPESRSHWMDSIRSAITKLQDASGVPLISLEDGVEYLTYPNIVIDRPQKSWKSPVIEVNLPDEIFVPERREPYERASIDERMTAIGDIAAKYGHLSSVWRTVAKYESDVKAALITDIEDRKIVDHALQDIERGLVTLHDLGGTAVLPNLPEDTPPQELLKLTTAYHLLLGSFRPLIVNIGLARSKHTGLPHEEYVQEGYMALIRAIASYNPEKQKRCPFPTYVRERTLYHFAEIRKHSRPYSIPGLTTRELSKLHTTRTKLASDLGRPPSFDELVQKTSYTRQRLGELLLMDRFNLPSLDEPVRGDEFGLTLGSIVANKTGLTSEIPRTSADRLKKVQDILFSDKLGDASKFFIGLRFGLDPSIMPDVSLALPNGRELTYYEAYEQILDSGHTTEGLGEISRITGWEPIKITRKINDIIYRLRHTDKRKSNAALSPAAYNFLEGSTAD